MNDYKIPIIEPTIDYTKVPPINQKRTISFINHFIVHTVTYLNKFALSCEEKLFEFENKLQRVEASLELLESWLSSVPDLEQNRKTQKDNETDLSKTEVTEVTESDVPDNVTADEPKNEHIVEQQTSVNKDPRYEKYLKLIHIGVSKGAVKLKMEQEGLDFSILNSEPQQTVSKPKSSEVGVKDDI